MLPKLLLLFALLVMANVPYQEDATPEVTVEATAESTPAGPTFPEPGSYTARENYDGLERSYRIYIPESYVDQDEPVALVLVFHGAGGTGEWIETFSGFNELADDEGFVVVYPDGVNGVWNDGRVGDRRVGDIDDRPFVTDILDYITENLNIDPERVYATGYSMGGMFSFRLGCDMRDRITGVASVASTFPEYLLTACERTSPVPVIVLQGTDDPVIPWAGARGAYLSAVNTLTYWSLHNQCRTYSGIEALDDFVPGDNTRVMRESYTDCLNNADVLLYGVYFGGHTWPGGPFQTQFNVGNTTLDIHAAQAIWNFFTDLE